MKTSTTYTIEEPCTQNWAQMEKRTGERFCESCQKCVIDFSGDSTTAILQKLNQATGAVCGRLSQAQLDQLNYHLLSTSSSRNWMKYLGVLAIGASIFAQDAKALTQATPVKIEKSIFKAPDNKKPLKVKTVYGYIVNDDKQPLAGAKVSIDQTQLFAITDKNGRYEINLGTNFNPKYQQLTIKHEGMILAHLRFDYSKERQVQFQVSTAPMIMGLMIAVPKGKAAVKDVKPSN